MCYFEVGMLCEATSDGGIKLTTQFPYVNVKLVFFISDGASLDISLKIFPVSSGTI